MRKVFGTLKDGRDVSSYSLCNANGLKMTVLEYGCVIQSLKIPVDGADVDVVLGFDNIENYVASHSLPAPPHFGAVIGRYSGRIKNGKFAVNNQQFQLNANNGPHSLHGGPGGFDKVLWHVTDVSENAITFEYLSVDGDENFPGNLKVSVRYTLTESNEVVIEYGAISDADTIINMTQHSYFNMDGHTGNVLQQQLLVNASQMLETNQDIVPTGRIISASAHDYNFEKFRSCPVSIDASFIVNDTAKPAAILRSAKTGLQLSVFSDQLSVHLYIGGNLFGKMHGKDHFAYHPHSGICFESQNFPDAPNNPNFPDAILRKGEQYTHKTIWKFNER